MHFQEGPLKVLVSLFIILTRVRAVVVVVFLVVADARRRRFAPPFARVPAPPLATLTLAGLKAR